jgi:hypothetical protein
VFLSDLNDRLQQTELLHVQRFATPTERRLRNVMIGSEFLALFTLHNAIGCDSKIEIKWKVSTLSHCDIPNRNLHTRAVILPG